jgi:hypothetical protein
MRFPEQLSEFGKFGKFSESFGKFGNHFGNHFGKFKQCFELCLTKIFDIKIQKVRQAHFLCSSESSLFCFDLKLFLFRPPFPPPCNFTLATIVEDPLKISQNDLLHQLFEPKKCLSFQN